MERLTGMDATFLYLETPTHHMHVAMTMVIDPSTMPGGYSFEKIKDVHRRPAAPRAAVPPPARGGAVPAAPPGLGRGSRLRPRLPRPPHRRAGPGRAPRARRDRGPDRQPPLDRARPLWELWVVEGLKHDRRRRRREGPPLRHRRRVRRRADGPPVRPRADAWPTRRSARRASPSTSRPTSSCSGTPPSSRVRRNLGLLAAARLAPLQSRQPRRPGPPRARSTASAPCRSPRRARRGTAPLARSATSPSPASPSTT